MESNLLKIRDKLKSKIFFNHNIGRLTWFRTGGNARIFIIVENSEELEIILNEANIENFYVLGSGSNLLIRDKGFDGIIIKLGKGFNNITTFENKIEVGASVLDISLSNYALKKNIEGFEFYSGIPGSLGGAVKMNAGCFGCETKDKIHSVEIFKNKFQKKILKKKEINLDYRSSNIQNNEIISKVTFTFDYGNSEIIRQKMQNIRKKRISSQPIKNKTSGSTFKNPKNFHAAKLIEDSGCKGMSYGNAYVSDLHSNFLINNGNASASDLETLGKLIIEKVNEKFQIQLDWEIKIIGD